MKAVVGVVIMFLLGAMFLSLFQMSMGMSMMGGMSDCPFMVHDEVICPMDLAEHIGAWKSAFLATTPTITLLLVAAGVILFVVSTLSQLTAPQHRSISILHNRLRERTYSFVYRPLQELFANGILHPKIF